MARIKTYGNDATITDQDRVLGTDAADNSTKNFTVEDLRTHIISGGRFGGIVPQDRYILVDENNAPKQGLIYEVATSEDDVAIPANYAFRLISDNDGFIVEIDRYGLANTFFPYDINSIIGKSWVSSDYTTAGEQVITAFLDPRFTATSTAGNQTWRFRTTISSPLPTDVDDFVGRALTSVVISSLDRRVVNVGADLNILGSGGGSGGGTTFGNSPGQVVEWAQGGNTDLIPTSKFPNIVVGDVHTYSSTALRNAATDVVWHQGDVAIISDTTTVAYLYIGTDQITAGVTTNADWLLITSSSGGLTQAAGDLRYAAIANAFNGFGSNDDQVATWAEGNDTSQIPANKLENAGGVDSNSTAGTIPVSAGVGMDFTDSTITETSGLITLTSSNITSVLASAAVSFSITVTSVPSGIAVGQTVTFSNDFIVDGPNINDNALQGIVTTVTELADTVITLDPNPSPSFSGISINYPATAGSVAFQGDASVELDSDLTVTGITTLNLEHFDTSGTQTADISYRFQVYDTDAGLPTTRDANTIYLVTE